LPQRLVREWTDARLSFAALLRDARSSLSSAVGLAIRLGLPLSLLFVAVNTIWGFTWYFNTESWASAFYQKMAELRVDTWRAGMVDGVMSAYAGKSANLFRVTPPGIDDQDFSFIVIGDPGEGDASQYALIERYLEIGRRDDVKFLVIASDVIYPAGAMADYEKNFHLPFKGFKKPIYAIPGNHDWFDALEGFNANFLEPQAARAALAARADTDFHLTSTGTNRIDRLVNRARQLRELYGIQNGLQHGPFFEIQTADFALIAIDTGILRTIDDRQRAWLTDALARAGGKFTMVIPGHPKYAGGTDTSIGDDAFSALYATFENAGVDVVMAGDTHAFEYYVQYNNVAGGARPVYHFVNGGGGAYLSIGGALGWPDALPVETWAFYPAPGAVRAKLDAETPTWKQPFWAWIKRFGAWPVSTETLSGIFDFNHAPFYQSFIEVRVERSRKRVVFALQAANGPVRWRDLHASFKGVAGTASDAPVEFIVYMKASGG
jgi:predicted phosphodiesterase